MRSFLWTVLAVSIAASAAPAQPPGSGRGRADDVDSFVAKMMAFDKNKDGKLTRDEITDPRLLRLFERADTNKDGVVTQEELVALFQKENQGGGGRGFGGDGPPGGSGGRGRGGLGRPGQVLPDIPDNQLGLTDEQKKQIADVQTEVDARLNRILTADQKARLREMRDRGRGPGGPPPP